MMVWIGHWHLYRAELEPPVDGWMKIAGYHAMMLLIETDARNFRPLFATSFAFGCYLGNEWWTDIGIF